jgi:hypothetical protein
VLVQEPSIDGDQSREQQAEKRLQMAEPSEPAHDQEAQTDGTINNEASNDRNHRRASADDLLIATELNNAGRHVPVSGYEDPLLIWFQGN